jgi:hypothetical protein
VFESNKRLNFREIDEKTHEEADALFNELEDLIAEIDMLAREDVGLILLFYRKATNSHHQLHPS